MCCWLDAHDREGREVDSNVFTGTQALGIKKPQNCIIYRSETGIMFLDELGFKEALLVNMRLEFKLTIFDLNLFAALAIMAVT